MFEEEIFYQRLAEIFNDLLLTNRYLSTNGPNAATNLLRDFPDARWFDPGEGERDAQYRRLRQLTNDGIATAPLELINHIVKNNKPLSEMLTVDYMMVNPYSSKSYGLEGLSFIDGNDPKEFVQAQLPGIPHSGLLTSIMFLNRYPTSRTNKNRGRARVVYDFFLGVDILALDGYSRDIEYDNTSRLIDDDSHYHLIYGGIDSFDITERLTEPNGLMVTVQERMANELACYGVPNDFLKSPSERLLVPEVEIDTLPFDGLGQQNPEAIAGTAPMSLVRPAFGATADRFLITVSATGGWDPTSLMDPKGDAAPFAEQPMAFISNGGYDFAASFVELIGQFPINVESLELFG